MIKTKLPAFSHRKLAKMYWALALGEEPERAQPSKMSVTTSPT
jgi:hypothetical protein